MFIINPHGGIHLLHTHNLNIPVKVCDRNFVSKVKAKNALQLAASYLVLQMQRILLDSFSDGNLGMLFFLFLIDLHSGNLRHMVQDVKHESLNN